MSTKTLRKRIALVAVSALGFGLLSIIPANAGVVAEATAFKVIAAGTDQTAPLDANATEPQVWTRAGQTIGVSNLAFDDTGTAGAKWRPVLSATAAGGAITTIASGTGATPVVLATLTGSFTATAAMNGLYLRIEVADDGTTFGGASAVGVKLNVVNAGAPVGGYWDQASTTQLSASPVDYTQNFYPTDANGKDTILLDGETIGIDVAPTTGATASTVIVTDASKSEEEGVAGDPTAGYSVNLDGFPAGGTGSTLAGTTYSITAQILSGTSAIGAPVTALYKRLSNSSTLTGSIAFISNKAYNTPLTALTLSPSVASNNFYVLATDSNGGVIKGATVAVSASAGTVSASTENTDAAGQTSTGFTTTQSAGTATITATITTGSTSITTSVVATTTAFGTTTALASGFTVSGANGSGLKVGNTRDTWSAALNTTSFTVSLSGLSASKSVKLVQGGSATGVKVNGVANGTVYPTADASGVVTVTGSLTSATAGQTWTLAADAANDGPDATLTITFNTAAGAITTVPAASSLNVATLSSTNPIAASVADQFGNVVTGGSVRITNTSVPAGATAATTKTVPTGTAGSATVNAVIGAVAGSYVFSVQAYDANGSTVGSASSITYQATATGLSGSLTLTDNDATALTLTTDNLGSRTIIRPGTTGDVGTLSAAGTLNTENYSVITVATTVPAGLSFSATATNGIRLFTTDRSSATLSIGASTVTGTAGTTSIYAVPTLAGAGTITVTSGGRSVVYTLNGLISSTPKASIVTLTAGANANGKAAYTVKTTDAFGNVVAADVNITMSGAGYLSNGFKNMTLTTLATDGSNSFDVISDGSSASGITATIAGVSVVTSTNATAWSVSASVASATASVTVVQPVVPVKSKEVLAAEEATAAAKAAGDAAVTAAQQAAKDAVAAADKAAAASKAAGDAAVAAAKAAQDAAVAAAQQAAKDAVAAADKATAAAKAAQDAAVEAAQQALDAASEATDAANAATDAANASAEAGDAATAAAQDAADAVAALATQVNEQIAALNAQNVALSKQITALTNLIIKIQKKVKA